MPGEVAIWLLWRSHLCGPRSLRFLPMDAAPVQSASDSASAAGKPDLTNWHAVDIEHSNLFAALGAAAA